MIRCPELMFKPSLDGKEMMGLHELTKKTVNDCDLDVRKDLLGNVVMSGGTTMFPNMPERLQAELQGLVPEATKVKVIAPPERMISVWIGGSILASLSTSVACGSTVSPTLMHNLQLSDTKRSAHALSTRCATLKCRVS